VLNTLNNQVISNLAFGVRDLLGKGAPLVVALLSFLGVLQLLDVLNVGYYPMIHRASVIRSFDLGFSLVFPLVFLLIILVFLLLERRRIESLIPIITIFLYHFIGLEGAVSIAAILASVIGFRLLCKPVDYFSWFFVLLGGFEFASLLHWIIFVPFGLRNPVESIASIEMSLFYIGIYLAPLFVLAFLFMWVIKFYNFFIMKKESAPIMLEYGNNKSSNLPVIILSASVFLSIISSLYPYSATINPNSINVGVDIPNYVNYIESINSDYNKVFTISNGTRPIIFLLIIGFQKSLNLSTLSAVRLIPVVIHPLLIISIFFLTIEIVEDKMLASLASFFTACGYQLTVNIYSYYLANTLGLCFIFMSLGFLFKTLKNKNIINLSMTSLFGVLLLFTHPWTFIQYISAALLLTIITYILHRDIYNEQFQTLIIYLIILFLFEIIKIQLIYTGGTLSTTSGVVNNIIGFDKFWYNNIFIFRYRYGGLLSNLVVMGLAIIGLYKMKLEDVMGKYFIGFLFLTSLFYLIGDQSIKCRLFYNIPIGLFASLGFVGFYKSQNIKFFKYSFCSYIVLYSLTYFFRIINNII
jgi:hypothetical protein